MKVSRGTLGSSAAEQTLLDGGLHEVRDEGIMIDGIGNQVKRIRIGNGFNSQKEPQEKEYRS